VSATQRLAGDLNPDHMAFHDSFQAACAVTWLYQALRDNSSRVTLRCAEVSYPRRKQDEVGVGAAQAFLPKTFQERCVFF
jgi:hypothetical protein